MIIALDSSVLGHILSSKPKTDEQKQAWADAHELVSVSGADLVIPAPVVSEVLAHLRPDVRVQVAATISQSFPVLALDFEGASIAGTLWRPRNAAPKDFVDLSRQALKVDHLILGCAARWSRVEGFCTTDDRQARAALRLPRKLVVGDPGVFFARLEHKPKLPGLE